MLCVAVCATIALAALPARAQTITLQSILAARAAAMAKLHARDPKTLHVAGVIQGEGLNGFFTSWLSGENSRDDEEIGMRKMSTLRRGDSLYAIDENGNVRQLRGLLLARSRTEELIDSGEFARRPQNDRYTGTQTLPDGRTAYAIVVAPPGGQPETVYLDTRTLLIDRLAYTDVDRTMTDDYYDYGTFGGAVVARRVIESDGEQGYDLERQTTAVIVDKPVSAAVFAVPQSPVIQTATPVTVPLEEHQGHYYVRVSVRGHDLRFLLDSGAQGIVFDTRTAAKLGLVPIGSLEVEGAQRTGGLGIVALDGLQIGGVTLPLREAAIIDLHNAGGSFDMDGVLGYPFFAEAEVQLDATRHTLTFAKPGMLHAPGDGVPVDVDRQLVEIAGSVNGTPGQFVLDTGNTSELLIFAPFMAAHPSLIPYTDVKRFASNYGVGGSVRAVAAHVDELRFGSYKFYNRVANVMETSTGAFADRFDAGNIGMGVLQNLIVTFDLAHERVFFDRSSAFDDGRYRPNVDCALNCR